MGPLILLAVTTVAIEQPPAAAALLAAIAAGDLNAARGTLAPDVVIMRGIDTTPTGSSLEVFMGQVRGCARTQLQWETDAGDRSRTAVTVSWTCPPQRNVTAYIWTVGPRVVHIQFE